MIKNYTKVYKKNGNWILLKRADDNKYKLIYKSTDKKEVLKQREASRYNLAEAKTYVDVRISDLDYYKLEVISKTLKHKTYNKTISYLIEKAHADCIKQSA